MRIKKVKGRFKVKQPSQNPEGHSLEVPSQGLDHNTEGKNKCRVICLGLIDKIILSTKIDRTEFVKFLRLLRINITSHYSKRFLIVVSTSDPESILDAYYSYLADKDKYDHRDTSANIKRFLRFLINSKAKTINLVKDVKIVEGVVDTIDDIIAQDELDRCIGVLEDEVY